MTFVLRLAVGSGRTAAVRLLLVIAGVGVAAALLLTATGIATLDRNDLGISGATGTITYADGTTVSYDEPGSSGPITTSYLTEPELRRGVTLGFVLCVIPLLVFVGTASRVAVRRRDERLAGLRLAGATEAQVRLLAALDAATGAAFGALLGSALFLAGRAAVLSASDGQLRDIAVAVLPPLLPALGVLLLLVAGTAAAAAVAMRSVLITPLGVVRRAPRRHPRPWGLLILVLGLGAFAIAAIRGVPDTATGDAALGGSLALSLVGLVACGPWLTSLTGRAAGRLARGPALLLAGRRLEDDPRAQARAMSAVVLVVVAATLGLVSLEDYRRTSSDDPYDDGFYLLGYSLAAFGMLFSLTIAAAGLLLTTLEGLLERRRTLAAQQAAGVPLKTLRRAVLLRVSLPVLPAASLAVLAALATVRALASGELVAVPVEVLLLPPLAALVCAAAAGCTLPTLRRAADMEHLRVP